MKLINKSSSMMILFVFILNILHITFSNQIRGLDDSILFKIKWPGFDEKLLNSDQYEKLEMTTSNNEKFQCLIPIHYGDTVDTSSSYTGKNAFNILLGYFNKKTCTLRLESYWTYEICHGRYIRQYYESRTDNEVKSHEFLLGEISSEDILKQASNFEKNMAQKPAAEIPTTKVDGVEMPYVRVDYKDGTFCDLTNQPRISHILYVCFEEGRHDVFSIKEILTCEYEIIILSPILCQHPSYRPREIPQTDVQCVSMAHPGPKMPRNGLEIQSESYNYLINGENLVSDLYTGALKAVPNDGGKMSAFQNMNPVNIIASKNVHPKTPPSVDQKLIEDFLNGDYCPHGGSGWWHYRFCYGKHVEQYHENKEKGGSKTTITLGVFDKLQHVEWIYNNPNKQYRDGKKHVSHFYSQGSICDLDGKPRTVEVKLKCKEGLNSNAFSMYLLEPTPCQYFLGIESSVICSLLDYVGNHGLFEISKSQQQDMISNIGLENADKTATSRDKTKTSKENEKELNEAIEKSEEGKPIVNPIDKMIILNADGEDLPEKDAQTIYDKISKIIDKKIEKMIPGKILGDNDQDVINFDDLDLDIDLDFNEIKDSLNFKKIKEQLEKHAEELQHEDKIGDVNDHGRNIDIKAEEYVVEYDSNGKDDDDDDDNR